MQVKPHQTYLIKGNSNYFKRKYGTSNPTIVVEEKLNFHFSHTPPSFLYLARALCEDLSLDNSTYYGHIDGLGEFIHESELEETK